MQPSLFTVALAPLVVGRASIGERLRAKALTPGTGKIKGYDYALNSYVGCGFGCTYCYAQFFVADEERRAAWGTWVDVKSGVVQEVLRHDLRGKSVLMSSATDPYQPLEAKTEITRAVLEALSPAHRQPKLFVQSRSPLVTRDIDLLQRFSSVRVSLSITTDDDAIRKEFEPNCASIDRRFEALAEVKRAGIPIGVSMSPLLPIRDVRSFAKRLRDLAPDRAFTQVFHQTERAFTSNTPAWVVAKARAMGWGPAEEAEARRLLAELVPALRR